MIKAYGDMDMPAGLSWNGFVIEGTPESIKEVSRCIHEAANVEVFWRKEVLRLRAIIKAYEELNKNKSWEGEVDRMSGAFTAEEIENAKGAWK